MRKYVIISAILVGCYVLIDLLLAGLCHVREMAARTQCSNNLRQIGHGLHNYAAFNQDRLPSGTIPNEHLEPEQRLSWIAPLLPFIE